MIVVTGADGLVGRALREVLEQGRRPWRELVRRDARAGEGVAERRIADVTSAADAARELADARAVVHLAGVAPGMRPARDDHEVAAMGALLDALRGRALERFVFLSATGAARDAAHPWLRAKGQAEELLRASGLPFTILRAGLVFAERARALAALMLLIRGGTRLRLPVLRAGRVLPIAAGDVAIALASALDHHRMVGRTIEVGAAPELTLERLLERIAQRLGRPLELGRWPGRGIALAEALARVPDVGLTDAEAWLRLFAVAEVPDLTDYQQLLPMHRVDFVEELRTYSWGPPPPRPGEPLPVLQAPEDPSLPLIIPGSTAGGDASRFGRVDAFGRVESKREPPPDRGAP